MKIVECLCVVFFLFTSCKRDEVKTYDENIIVRNFSFVSNNYNKLFFNKKKLTKKNMIFYIYSFENKIDILQIYNKDIFYNNNKLTLIDSKNIENKGIKYSVSKYFLVDKVNYKNEKFLYLNNDVGLLFIEDSYGSMYEYEVEKYNILHKSIALNTFNFKEGGFYHIKYAEKKYIEYE